MAWCPAESAPNLLALGTSVVQAAGTVGGSQADDVKLEFVNFDPARPGTEMEVLASVPVQNGQRFSSMSWGFGPDGSREGFPYGVLAGGQQQGIVSLWNPYAITRSQGADQGLVHQFQVHNGAVHCIEFNALKPNLIATCGADADVKILNVDKLTQPEVYPLGSSTQNNTPTEVLCCAWNRKVPHILCSCSNKGSTVVWDLKQKKEVITFQDPSGRQRCASVAWHPEVPTQLIVAYDDDQQPSLQMWDLRHVQYPCQEMAQGHSKGILGLAWNIMDPNLLLSCGKDNKIVCWNISSGTLEPFCEMVGQQWNFEAKWAPHKPSVISAASINGLVSLYSVQEQQNTGVKYCPRWYKKPCGATFGFGGRILSFGTKVLAASITNETQKATSSFCHSLIIPNEPDVVPGADLFERWIAERRLREYCSEKTKRVGGNQHEALMWELMGSCFESGGQSRVPTLLGFSEDEVVKEAEKYLGQPPGTLLGSKREADTKADDSKKSLVSFQTAPAVSAEEATSIFDQLAASTAAEKEREVERQQKAQEEAAGLANVASASGPTVTDWSRGPEAIIKQSLLVGNLTAAVECCFKSNRMAEALLLASGGGTELFTRARDEYLRLQGDAFLSSMGNIMTNDFEELVGSSNLNNWKETLAILATYCNATDRYQALCEQLAERLEKEKFDIRSAVISYICAGNFAKTASIWAAQPSQGSQKLALQDLVEKMAVLQEATKFNQTDTIFNAKLTQYAEILANSGRLTAAMRYLCLLRDDVSSSILRDRIYHSAPSHMTQVCPRPPACPFQVTDVRVMVQQQQPAQPQQHLVHREASNFNRTPVQTPGPSQPPHSAGTPLPPRPNVGFQPMPAPAPAPHAPSHAPSPPGFPGHGGGMGPPGFGGGMGAPGHAGNMGAPAHPGSMGNPTPNAATSGLPPKPRQNLGVGGLGPGGMAPAPGIPGAGGPPVMAGNFSQPGASSPGGPPVAGNSKSTAPTAAAMPVAEGMPTPWPLPSKTQQLGSTTRSVAEANKAVQDASLGGSSGQAGDPMQPHDLTHVKNVLGMMLDLSAQDGNTRKREDVAKRMEDLYSKLSTGQVKNNTSAKVLEVVQSIEAQDYRRAQGLVRELTTSDWELNRYWVQGLQRLVPQR